MGIHLLSSPQLVVTGIISLWLLVLSFRCRWWIQRGIALAAIVNAAETLHYASPPYLLWKTTRL